MSSDWMKIDMKNIIEALKKLEAPRRQWGNLRHKLAILCS